jgi:hypothetical protein
MNRRTLHSAAAALVAAIALGCAGTTAQAATSGPPPAASRASAQLPGSAQLTPDQAARQLAANLLTYEGASLTAQDRAELRAIADGAGVAERAGGKFGALLNALKKVKGFAQAVAKSYAEFKAWFDRLPWYVKAPLQALGVGSNLLDIWQLFH